MRSATSCFNKTIIRTDVKRFWPLLFLYTGIWAVVIPVYQWVELGYGYVEFPGDYLYNALTGSLVMAVIFGCLFAVAVFSYMMNARSVGLMHSLPVSRGTQFGSHVASVLGMLTAGKLVVAVLTVYSTQYITTRLTTGVLRAMTHQAQTTWWLKILTLLSIVFMVKAVTLAQIHVLATSTCRMVHTCVLRT